VVPISAETRAIIKRKTHEEYLTSADLPALLDLSGCEDLLDVSALGQVEILCLLYCTGVADVSVLGGVRKLIQIHCAAVTDVSALGSVKELNMCGCTGVSDAWVTDYSLRCRTPAAPGAEEYHRRVKCSALYGEEAQPAWFCRECY